MTIKQPVRQLTNYGKIADATTTVDIAWAISNRIEIIRDDYNSLNSQLPQHLQAEWGKTPF